MRKAIFIATLIGALIGPAAALASRPANLNQAVDILDGGIGSHYSYHGRHIALPVGCAKVRMSTASTTWASVRYSSPKDQPLWDGVPLCTRFAINGITIHEANGQHPFFYAGSIAILNRERGHWQVVAVDSLTGLPAPSCAGFTRPQIPASVAHDLIPFVNCANVPNRPQ